jgi:hypothetical protein
VRAASAVALVVLVLPRLAEACPMCASQQPGGVARVGALGVMLLLPFAVAFVLFRALRRTGGAARAETPRGRAAAGAGREHAAGIREQSP